MFKIFVFLTQVLSTKKVLFKPSVFIDLSQALYEIKKS